MKMRWLIAMWSLWLAATSSLLAQGRVKFNNRVIGVVVAPIYGVHPVNFATRLAGNASTNGGTTDYTGCPLLQGTGWTVALWAKPVNSGDIFSQLAQTTFRTSAGAAGFIQPPVETALIPWVYVSGTAVDFQVRVWDNLNGAVPSWAAALATGTSTGISDPFTTQVSLMGNSFLLGLTSFNVTRLSPPVPEPSVIVLASLTGVALLWRRRVNRKV